MNDFKESISLYTYISKSLSRKKKKAFPFAFLGWDKAPRCISNSVIEAVLFG